MSRHNQTRDPRLAGDVVRYHTWRNIQTQTVAAHSWHLQRILLAIWPEAPRHVIIHCMTHDVGEVVTGDLPYPFKSQHPEIKLTTALAETSAHLTMSSKWGLPPPIELTDQERNAVKLAEFIEMMEFALVEIEMGNQHHILIYRDCLLAAEKIYTNPDLLPEGCRAGTYIQMRVGTHMKMMESA